ncbi:MAG TPA: DUF4129 domain-containing protein [Gemmatimonadales bacterium]|nr:DUF4129 domain-containing protein [Gemmatimonadales bacterium]
MSTSSGTAPAAQAADSLGAVLDSVFAGSAYQWSERRGPLWFLHDWWEALGEWLARLQGRHPELFDLLFWLLVAVLVGIFLHGAWIMYRTVQAAQAPRSRAAGPAPAPPPRGAQWYRREAERLAALGRYAEAMQHDFLALALELDARRVVRFHPSKTPNEYAREARLPDESRGALKELVHELYAVAFARRPCGPSEYVAWRARLESGLHAPAH